MTTTAPSPARVVACAVAGIDVVLLLVAAWFAVDTYRTLSSPGDHGFARLGYFVAGLFAFVALPSLAFAVAAIRARGATAVACAAVSVIILAAVGVFAVSYL